MNDIPVRTPLRLSEYDYSQNGAYFVTVCTKDRAHLFGRIVGAGHPAPTASLPKVVSALKSLCTRSAKRPLWQRGYYEHVIRNREDFLSCGEYIEGNPAKWLETAP